MSRFRPRLEAALIGRELGGVIENVLGVPYKKLPQTRSVKKNNGFFFSSPSEGSEPLRARSQRKMRTFPLIRIYKRLSAPIFLTITEKEVVLNWVTKTGRTYQLTIVWHIYDSLPAFD